MWAVSVIIFAVAATWSFMLFRIRRREVLAWRSAMYIAMPCIGQAILATAVKIGAVSHISGTAASATVAIAAGLGVPVIWATGVQRNDRGKLRPRLQGNAISKHIDSLVVEQSRAALAANRPKTVALLMERQSEPSRLGHPLFDAYLYLINEDGSNRIKLARQVRTTAGDLNVPLEVRLSVVLSFVLRERDFEFYRRQVTMAKGARRRARRFRRAKESDAFAPVISPTDIRSLKKFMCPGLPIADPEPSSEEINPDPRKELDGDSAPPEDS
jgi:hypothetical protein